MSKDGGPAFPNTEVYNPHDGSPMFQGSSGMSLRDYFAAKAMQAIAHGFDNLTQTQLAEEAYRIADAMLAARSSGDKQP